MVKTIVQSIARVMNLINSLAAISVYVGGCNCMLLVPMKTKHSHFCFYSGVGSVAAVAAIAATLFWPEKKKNQSLLNVSREVKLYEANNYVLDRDS